MGHAHVDGRDASLAHAHFDLVDTAGVAHLLFHDCDCARVLLARHLLISPVGAVHPVPAPVHDNALALRDPCAR